MESKGLARPRACAQLPQVVPPAAQCRSARTCRRKGPRLFRRDGRPRHPRRGAQADPVRPVPGRADRRRPRLRARMARRWSRRWWTRPPTACCCCMTTRKASTSAAASSQFSFKSLGVQAQGRTTILKINYRNTKQILQTASLIAADLLTADDKDDDGIPLVQPVSCGRDGPPPLIIRLPTLRDEAWKICRTAGQRPRQRWPRLERHGHHLPRPRHDGRHAPSPCATASCRTRCATSPATTARAATASP